jgi:hypothetical protein
MKKGFTPLITEEEVEFVKEFGKPFKKNIALSLGKLRELKFSEDSRVSKTAQSLYDKLYRNRNGFIDFEKQIVDRLGVDINTEPYTIRFHRGTGRVSVAWVATTSSIYNTIKLAMIAPPNDIKKKAILRSAIRSRPEYVSKIKKELHIQGLDLESWWVS